MNTSINTNTHTKDNLIYFTYERIKRSKKIAIDLAPELFRVVSRFGAKAGNIAVFSDPDDTYTIILTPESLTVQINEGEMEGEIVYNLDRKNAKMITFNPGPWIQRAMIFLDRNW